MRRHGCASKLHLQRVVKSSVTAEPVYPRIEIVSRSRPMTSASATNCSISSASCSLYNRTITRGRCNLLDTFGSSLTYPEAGKGSRSYGQTISVARTATATVTGVVASCSSSLGPRAPHGRVGSLDTRFTTATL